MNGNDKEMKLIAFNNLLKEFINFLLKNFEDENIVKYNNKINVCLRLNPLLIYNFFKKEIIPYEKFIINCDEKFLLKELTSIFSENSIEFLDFNQIWNNKENDITKKAKIFHYLRKLLKLCN